MILLIFSTVKTGKIKSEKSLIKKKHWEIRELSLFHVHVFSNSWKLKRPVHRIKVYKSSLSIYTWNVTMEENHVTIRVQSFLPLNTCPWLPKLRISSPGLSPLSSSCILVTSTRMSSHKPKVSRSELPLSLIPLAASSQNTAPPPGLPPDLNYPPPPTLLRKLEAWELLFTFCLPQAPRPVCSQVRSFYLLNTTRNFSFYSSALPPPWSEPPWSPAWCTIIAFLSPLSPFLAASESFSIPQPE